MTTPPNLRRFHVTETREAMEVTRENLDEVAAWCGGEAYHSRVEHVRSFVWFNNGTRRWSAEQAEAGLHVIVRDPRGLRRVKREEFERESATWTEVRSVRGGREVREDNLDAIAAWVGGEVVDQGAPVGRGVLFKGACGIGTFAWPGDVVVPEGDGHDVVPQRDLIEESP